MTTDLFDLNDKIALVTGASRGIGAEAARLLAQTGRTCNYFQPQTGRLRGSGPEYPG